MNEDTYNKEEDKELSTDLQDLINEVQAGENQQRVYQEPERGDIEQRNKIDILDLPPRKEVHSDMKGRTHIKFSKPLLRLFIIIILLGIIAGIYFIL